MHWGQMVHAGRAARDEYSPRDKGENSSPRRGAFHGLAVALGLSLPFWAMIGMLVWWLKHR
jgi:hypothetical protein